MAKELIAVAEVAALAAAAEAVVEEEAASEEEEFSPVVAAAEVAAAAVAVETSSVTNATGWGISLVTAVKRWTGVTSVTKWDISPRTAQMMKSTQEVATTAGNKDIARPIVQTEKRGVVTNAMSQVI